MNVFRFAILFLPIILFGLTACSTNTPSETTDTDTPTTIAVSLTEEATIEPDKPTQQPTLTSTPSQTPTATDTPTSTPTTTPSPTPEPKARTNEDLTTAINVREGPGTNYPVVGRLEPGEETYVTGRNEDSSWWQINLTNDGPAEAVGWVFGELVTIDNGEEIPLTKSPPTPEPPTPAPKTAAEQNTAEENPDAEALAEQLRCGKDFCVTYQAMVPMAENGGCVGNHSIYITVLQGPPPGVPMNGVVIGDTFNNVEMGSGSHGPGRTEITLWSNSMTLIAKRNMDGTPYTSEESFNFTSHDELIPAELLAANGYCGGTVEQCERDRNNNSVCRGHYSWRVTFHKFD